MPAMSPTMTKGNIANWIKNEGDAVEIGEPILEIETDKATLEFTAPKDGYIAKILQPKGTKDCAVGDPICIIVPDKDDIAQFESYVEIDNKTKQTSLHEKSIDQKQAHLKTKEAEQTIDKASPLAKSIAKKLNIDTKNIKGTGFDGQVTKSDVLSFHQNQQQAQTQTTQTPPPVTQTPQPVAQTQPNQQTIHKQNYIDIEISATRAIIAKRMTDSKSQIPHYYLKTTADITKTQTLRTQLNAKLAPSTRLSLNDFFLKAAALAMSKAPELNASWQGSHIRQYSTVDISFAVNTPKGLVTPTLRNVAAKGLQTINADSKRMVQKALDGKLLPDDYAHGTFTITSLSASGIEEFAAIINPPQVAILAIGCGVASDEKTKVSFVLSCDHRVVDGAVGAAWLAEFKKFVEEPVMMLVV